MYGMYINAPYAPRGWGVGAYVLFWNLCSILAIYCHRWKVL